MNESNKLKLKPDNMGVLLLRGRVDPGTEISPIVDKVALCSLVAVLDSGLHLDKQVALVPRGTFHQL